MRNNIEIKLNSVLELVACAEDWGFWHDVLFDAFGEMINYDLSDDEIEAYAREVESEEGHSIDDYEQVKERLTDFKKKYCTKENQNQ